MFVVGVVTSNVDVAKTGVFIFLIGFAMDSDEGAKFPPEKGRYHLFVAYACPWAHRTLMTRAIKGLEDAISVTVVYPIWQKTKPDDVNDKHTGWIFGREEGQELHNTIGLGGPFPPTYPNNGKFLKKEDCFLLSGTKENLSLFVALQYC